MTTSDQLLSVRDLTITAPGRAIPLVDRLSFDLAPGETLAVVGESGAGKSLTGLALLGLVPSPLTVTAARLRWRDRDLAGLSERDRRRIRGREIGMVFQDPSAALNPALPIGDQVAEALRVHRKLSRTAARAAALELLERVHLPAPAERCRAYPHELSGGMLQRVAIAVAIAPEPALLIADEPTTALDASVQREVLQLLAELQTATGMAMLFITHNLPLVAEMADRAIVMRHGRMVEQAGVLALFESPKSEYTRELLAAIPGTVRPRAPE
ncbi:MAG: ABC transporter ATP-binding protein [Verrucomicrobia bacterium]|nr:MAG: ABC transporter ATP-binding protein [Verrucomicrobiota bacterium]